METERRDLDMRRYHEVMDHYAHRSNEKAVILTGRFIEALKRLTDKDITDYMLETQRPLIDSLGSQDWDVLLEINGRFIQAGVVTAFANFVLTTVSAVEQTNPVSMGQLLRSMTQVGEACLVRAKTDLAECQPTDNSRLLGILEKSIKSSDLDSSTRRDLVHALGYLKAVDGAKMAFDTIVSSCRLAEQKGQRIGDLGDDLDALFLECLSLLEKHFRSLSLADQKEIIVRGQETSLCDDDQDDIRVAMLTRLVDIMVR